MAQYDLERRRLHQLWDVQRGVVSRRQLVGLGVTDNDIARMVRRRELVIARPGVYVSHNGPLSLTERQWVAIHAAWPAALCHESALPGRPPNEIHIAISDSRKVDPVPGVVSHRMAGIDRRIDWRSSPPRQRIEHAVIDVMAKRISSGDVTAAYAALTEACFRRTSPEQILRVLDSRARVRGRRLIAAMLSDVRDGANSVLERGYLRNVETAHGLPRGDRQQVSRSTGARTDQDVRYEKYGLIVELDGRAIHDNAASWDADARRDLAELVVAEMATARVTYGLVFNEACQTARQLEVYFRRRGWKGDFVRCPRCP